VAPPSREEASALAVLQIADAVGGLMESWGFKRNMGRMWTILYLEDRPLSAPELGERLQLSTGAVSMLLTELGQWGAARKTWVVGERREHYEAETSIWKMVSRVFRERELRWIQTALEQFEAAKAKLDAAPEPRNDAERDATSARSSEPASARSSEPDAAAARVQARNHLIAERVNGLTELARVGAHLLESMLQGEAVDHMPIKNLGELARLTKPDPKS
jgi:HTH-type transcriptional regulator, glycine betaine synthesis regulator